MNILTLCFSKWKKILVNPYYLIFWIRLPKKFPIRVPKLFGNSFGKPMNKAFIFLIKLISHIFEKLLSADYIKRCRKDDPHLDTCLAGLIESLRSRYDKGKYFKLSPTWLDGVLHHWCKFCNDSGELTQKHREFSISFVLGIE